MPLIFVSTNLKDEDVAADFERKLCEKVAEVLNKPMERITLTLQTGVRQLRAGSADPMISVFIYSVGVFDKEKNPTYTAALHPFLCELSKLPQKRVNLVYQDLLPHCLGVVPT